MNRIWIGTNWKMNKTLSEGLAYVNQLLEITKDLDPKIQLFVIPSYTSLWPIKEAVKGSRILLGAQNAHWEKQGPYTGEISPEMLKEIGLDLVELGHSERRQYYNENDYDLSKKVRTVLDFEMRPLLCVGENLDQKNHDIASEIVTMQLKVGLYHTQASEADKLLIAYEPVWAIGEKGIPADKNYVRDIHATIRKVLVGKFGEAGRQIPILYGGSVNEANSMDYLKLENVDGLFIGRAAWNLITFWQILADVQKYLK